MGFTCSTRLRLLIQRLFGQVRDDEREKVVLGAARETQVLLYHGSEPRLSSWRDSGPAKVRTNPSWSSPTRIFRSDLVSFIELAKTASTKARSRLGCSRSPPLGCGRPSVTCILCYGNRH